MGVTLFPLMIDFQRNNTWISINAVPIINTIREISNSISDSNMHDFMIIWIFLIIEY